MHFFIDETALKQAGARDLLNCLPEDFPGVHEAQIGMIRGEYPATILRQSWETFARNLEQFKLDMLILRAENENLRNQVANYCFHPLAKELESVQIALQEKSVQVKTALETIAQLRAGLEAEQRQNALSEKQIEELKEDIADLNRLTADQHKKLVRLFGDEQPT
jgi:hypothetical protein